MDHTPTTTAADQDLGDLETTATSDSPAGDTDELLVEEISIDGMCGVY